MEITVRDTIEADLPAIFAIRHDPRVRPFQFRLAATDTIESWKHSVLKTSDAIKRPSHRSATICGDDEVIGHITQSHFYSQGKAVVYCGWNLAPAHWGKGIAAAALTQLFDQYFDEFEVELVISDCFSTNQRCLRLLEKLGYEPASIIFVERILTMLTQWSLHRVCRFHLNRERWKALRFERSARESIDRQPPNH